MNSLAPRRSSALPRAAKVQSGGTQRCRACANFPAGKWPTICHALAVGRKSVKFVAVDIPLYHPPGTEQASGRLAAAVGRGHPGRNAWRKSPFTPRRRLRWEEAPHSWPRDFHWCANRGVTSLRHTRQPLYSGRIPTWATRPAPRAPPRPLPARRTACSGSIPLRAPARAGAPASTLCTGAGGHGAPPRASGGARGSSELDVGGRAARGGDAADGWSRRASTARRRVLQSVVSGGCKMAAQRGGGVADQQRMVQATRAARDERTSRRLDNVVVARRQERNVQARVDAQEARAPDGGGAARGDREQAGGPPPPRARLAKARPRAGGPLHGRRPVAELREVMWFLIRVYARRLMGSALTTRAAVADAPRAHAGRRRCRWRQADKALAARGGAHAAAGHVACVNPLATHVAIVRHRRLADLAEYQLAALLGATVSWASRAVYLNGRGGRQHETARLQGLLGLPNAASAEDVLQGRWWC